MISGNVYVLTIIRLQSVALQFVIHIKNNGSNFTISSQMEVFYQRVLLSGAEMSHTNTKLALLFSICQRGWLILYPTETGCLLLSFIKNKSQIRASRPLYYRAYTEHLPYAVTFRSTCAWVTISATPHPMGRESLEALWPVGGFMHVCTV